MMNADSFKRKSASSALISGKNGLSLIRVVVLASSPMVRAGLEAMVRMHERFGVVGDMSRNGDFAGAVPAASPDVIVADADARRPHALSNSPPVVLLADDLSRTELRRELHGGVRAILPRDANDAELAAAIEAVVAGLTVLSPEDMDVLLPAPADTPQEMSEPLTARESEVLALLSQGAANREIAHKLGISEHTAKFHVSSVLSKLGAATRTEAVARGMREGLIVI
jgi:DNA-binding NarL/FixJ family response regulator